MGRLSDKRKVKLKTLLYPMGDKLPYFRPWDAFLLMFCKSLLNEEDHKDIRERLSKYLATINKEMDKLDKGSAKYDFYLLAMAFPVRYAIENGPKNEREVDYMAGLLESDGWAFADAYKASNKSKDIELERIGEDTELNAAIILRTLSTGKKPDPRLVVVYFMLHEGYIQKDIANTLKVSVGTANSLVKKVKAAGNNLVVGRKGSAAPHVGKEYKHNNSTRGVAYKSEDVQDDSVDVYETIDENEWKNSLWED